MTKLFKLSLASMVLATMGFAYQTNGPLEVKVTGYKTSKKVPVNGTFKQVKFTSESNSNFEQYLKSLEVKINALSISISADNDPLKDVKTSNMRTLFNLSDGAKDSEIEAEVVDVKGNMTGGTLYIKVDLNDETKIVPFNYKVKDGKIWADGKIDILDFMMMPQFKVFKELVGNPAMHDDKSWSEVALSFTLPFSK